jgi:molybdate transport system permease protein
VYLLPAVVQPLQASFAALDSRLLEAAATLRASPLRQFFTVALPLAKPGLMTAAVLGFTHTVGEFGVVLMLGGNIAGETRVVSVQIYNHVEAMNYPQAHGIAALLVVVSFVLLLALYARVPLNIRQSLKPN